MAPERYRDSTGPDDTGIRLVWLITEDGLWVAEPGGEFAGMIVKSAEKKYERTDNLGRSTGLYPTLEAAGQSV